MIDTHVHLDVKQFNKNRDEIIGRARNIGITKFIIPAIESDNMGGILKLVDENKDIYFSSGNHPNRLGSYDISKIKEKAAHSKCVAIGECGLDWYRIPKGANIDDIKKNQKKVFRKQIELSIELNKPLILHSRDTDQDMYDVLMEYNDKLVGGVIHCFLGSSKLLELEKYGFYYGIGGVSTFKQSDELRESIKKIPIEKIIIETDAPYLTPRPQGKKLNKINEPSYTQYVCMEIADVLNISYKEAERITDENAMKLFFK